MIKNSVKPLLFLIICLTCLPGVQGNDSTYIDSSGTGKFRYITGGGGWAWHGLRDMGMSPMYYRGSHIYGITGYEARNENLIQFIYAGLLSGAVSPSIYPELTGSRMKSVIADASYSFLRQAGNFGNERGEWFLGGTFSGQFAFYKHNLFSNSAVNQHFLSTAGINSRISYPVGNSRRELTMVFQIHVPLLAAVLRNSYAYIKPDGFLVHENSNIESFYKSLEVFTVNKFSGVRTDLFVEYRLQNSNAWRLGYQWEYFEHRNVNLLKAARHGLYLHLMLNI